jgi:hypothetical protein
MTAPFVQQLRARPETLQLTQSGDDTLHIRVQLAEAWDAVQMEVSPDDPVQLAKVHALQQLGHATRAHEGYVVKLGGIEILDETLSLRNAGVRNGSTLLVMSRRRQPVR